MGSGRFDSEIEGLNYIHAFIQELEFKNVQPPMGDYGIIYSILENVRDTLEVESM